MSDATIWEPVDFIQLADGLEIHVDEIAMTIGKGCTALATHAWPEDGNTYALCRQVPAPVGASVPVDDDFSALDMLKWMVEAYHPQWHYTMEKTGYECSYCKCMFKTSKEFNDTSAHNVGCQWAQSKEWLQQQRGQG